jgi:F-type H+-transporting ATPase subunit b
MSILGNFLLLATEESGFGLNLNIFETNLINLSILITLLVYFGRNFLAKILTERRTTIATAIEEAESRQRTALAALTEQKANLAKAQATASQIKADAETAAELAREEILAQASRDVQRMREEAARDLNSQRERILMELRQRVSSLAMEQAEAQLRSQMDDSLQQQLIGQSIALLRGGS